VTLVAHPRVAPPGRARVWVGAFGCIAAPSLTWRLDTKPVVPVVVRALESARPVPAMVDAATPRAFTGIFEIGLPDLDRPHVLEISSGDDEAVLLLRSLPAALPQGSNEQFPNGWFNVLLVSCFHWDADRTGNAGDVVQSLDAEHRPHLSLLLGDQVYLDLPTLQNLADDVRPLAAKFEADYVRNWSNPLAFAKVLAAAPSVCIPDDHEFWNNFPHRSPFIQNSWGEGGRANWKAAAVRLFDAFQLSGTPLGAPLILDVPPLSFCLADTRSCRREDRTATLDAGSLAGIDAWAQRVAAQRLVPVFGTGQLLFDEAAGKLSGAVGDYTLANYADFPALARMLGRLARPDRKLVFVTGDVHWGRVVEAIGRSWGVPVAYEIISSPSSLVSFVGYDEARRGWSVVKSWFGARDPFPRHSAAADPPPLLAADPPAVTLDCLAIHKQRGDHVTVLSFRRHGFGVEMRITYFPIHGEARQRRPVEAATVMLTS
jgi:hypothetical protein